MEKIQDDLIAMKILLDNMSTRKERSGWQSQLAHKFLISESCWQNAQEEELQGKCLALGLNLNNLLLCFSDWVSE